LYLRGFFNNNIGVLPINSRRENRGNDNRRHSSNDGDGGGVFCDWTLKMKLKMMRMRMMRMRMRRMMMKNGNCETFYNIGIEIIK
jgi:hypothetical protein